MHKKILLALVVTASVTVLITPAFVGNVAAKKNPDPPAGSFNTPGNVLISDQFNNRIVEVDQQGNIVWSFGSGDPGLCPAHKNNQRLNPSVSNTIIGSNWAERLANGYTLIAGTGTPRHTSPALPQGCVDNRVIVVDQGGNIVWQYGQYGVTGNRANELNVPVSAIQLPSGNILITDQGNNRIIEVSLLSKDVVWSYGPTKGPGALNSPNSAELLDNGNIFIADENNNRAIEITRAGDIVWEWDNPLGTAIAFASRLPTGDTLITDSGSNRIIELDASQQVVFEYFTNLQTGSNPNPLPTNAVKLSPGDLSSDISIADQFNNRVFIITPNLSDNQDSVIDFQYGQLNVVGNGPDQLNGPYTAFVIGDYTGQTPPPSSFLPT